MSFIDLPVAEIQSAYAGRMASLYVQYVEMTEDLSPDERDADTLLTTLLQSLLINCRDLLGYLTKYEIQPVLGALLDDLPEEWGVGSSIVVNDGFLLEEFSLITCLNHLRTALNCPVDLDPEGECPATGFMPLYNEEEVVEGYCFVDSPLVRRGTMRHFRTYDAARRELQDMNAAMRLSIEEVRRGRFAICRDKEPYAPYCRLDLSVEELEKVLLALGSYLSRAGELSLGRPQRREPTEKKSSAKGKTSAGQRKPKSAPKKTSDPVKEKTDD